MTGEWTSCWQTKRSSHRSRLCWTVPCAAARQRVTTRCRVLAICLGLMVALLCPALALAQPEPPPPSSANQQGRPTAEDLLGNMVVVAGAIRPLPKIAVQPSLESNIEDITLRAVVRRDLDLCGEFELLPDSQAPKGLYLDDEPVDLKAWARTGAEAVVRVRGTTLPDGRIELRGLAYLINASSEPAFEKVSVVRGSALRLGSHLMADALIGALTGQPGGFASQLSFVYPVGRTRRAYVMDADGHDLRPVSNDEQLVLSPAFGPRSTLYYAASVSSEPFEVFARDQQRPVALNVAGSVYGLAFSRDGDQVAVSVATGGSISLFLGQDLLHLRSANDVPLALQPAFTPSGKLAFSGAGRWGQRIYVDGKPISPDGMNASAPAFCRHPDGVRAVFAVGTGKNSDLVATGELGGALVRLTQGQGQNNYPACSPDGRLIAFFSTRKSNEGPGLYLMRIDGTRPKRISTMLGDSLVWARLPAEPPAGAARSARAVAPSGQGKPAPAH
jgi:TolB protein